MVGFFWLGKKGQRKHTKTAETSSEFFPLKMDGWNMIHFLLGRFSLFSGANCYVSFREGIPKMG